MITRNTLPFVKMHGLGNDFVMIDKNILGATNLDLSSLAISISNRYTAIGCDQLIIYNKDENNNALYEMLIYNQDGSLAQFCGNASRCLAQLIYYETGERKVTIKTLSRQLLCVVNEDNSVSVNIGSVSFLANWMPEIEAIWRLIANYIPNLKEVMCIDVSNPHLVIFASLTKEEQRFISRHIQDSGLFKEGVNVNFVTIKGSNALHLDVWERGAGLTLACGSGACASFAAANKLGFAQEEAEVFFSLGSLNLKRTSDDIIMSGDSKLVARGDYYL